MAKIIGFFEKATEKTIKCFYTFWERFILRLRGVQTNGVIINGHLMLDGINKSNFCLGKNVIINSRLGANKIGYASPTIFQCKQGKITIGHNVGISNSAFVARKSDITIGNNVLIGAGCKFYTSDFHSINYEDRVLNNDKNIKNSNVTIKNGAFIGAGTTVLKGVTIGEHSVIGACSVVTKSVPDDEIWAGNPARFIKKLI